MDLEKKLKEAKEARVSLNAMRRTHAEKVKQQQSELEMLAKIQMQQKLELLRQQKSEQLEHMEVLRKERQGEFQKHVQQQQQVTVFVCINCISLSMSTIVTGMCMNPCACIGICLIPFSGPM